MDRYLEDRRSLLATGTPGVDSARRLAALTDGLLQRLVAASPAPPRGRWSLVALGGYGAGALLPASDIDLLLLSDEAAGTLKPFAESLLYPLWDAGLSVGHQVRSPKAHLKAVRDDRTILTASLTGRVIAGDGALGTSLLARCCADARKRSPRVLAELVARERPGSPYALEPDLKEGAGGRRDYDELVWLSAVMAGSPQRTPQALLDTDWIDEWEVGLVEGAAATVSAARWELALAGYGSRMVLEAADSLSS